MTVATLTAARRQKSRAQYLVIGCLALLTLIVFAVSLMAGVTFYSPADVLRVIGGEQVPGASFTVGTLRLPRACLALLAGAAFGIAGVTFQTLLRNPLASPDIIGVGAGASVAAVVGIIVFSTDQATTSFLAVVGALLTTGAIYLLAIRDGYAGARLILIGIAIAAMLESIVTYVLSRASSWDLPAAMRWLAGSTNSASWDDVVPLALAAAVLIPMLLWHAPRLELLRLGDDSATGLGVPVTRTRVIMIVGATALLAFGTAATGPIAFVAFMAGPIAQRISRPGASLMVPAGLVGALLVLVADLAGQYAFANRYPVGVVTGMLGAPFLIYLLVKTQRSGTTR